MKCVRCGHVDFRTYNGYPGWMPVVCGSDSGVPMTADSWEQCGVCKLSMPASWWAKNPEHYGIPTDGPEPLKLAEVATRIGEMVLHPFTLGAAGSESLAPPERAQAEAVGPRTGKLLTTRLPSEGSPQGDGATEDNPPAPTTEGCEACDAYYKSDLGQIDEDLGAGRNESPKDKAHHALLADLRAENGRLKAERNHWEFHSSAFGNFEECSAPTCVEARASLSGGRERERD